MVWCQAIRRRRRERNLGPGTRFASHDEGGASAVEFALLLPVFILLVMGALQFAYVVFIRHELYSAAQQVCRQLALGAETAVSARAELRSEMARLAATGTLEIVPPTPTQDARVELREPLGSLLGTGLFEPLVTGQEIPLRVVYRSIGRTN